MSVKKDATGRRYIQAEVEVPGTPEEVWQAIATGPGVSSWFVPTEIKPGVGGAVTCHFAPGMDSSANITVWDPPRRMASEGADLGPTGPTMAVEWLVEARSGGTCIVRVVHSLFADTDDWDDQLEGIESGWPAFFQILRLSLTHFRGLHSATFQVVAMAPGPRAWEEVTSWLGLEGAANGQQRVAPAGPPPLAGSVERTRDGRNPYVLLLLKEPASGCAFLSACSFGDQTMISLGFYLFGDRSAEIAARQEPLWSGWISQRLPMPSGPAQP